LKVTVLTPTCDRPAGIALLERMMARQTRQPDEWIVADGGATPARLTRGQTLIIDQRATGPLNFAQNLLNGIEAASGDLLRIAEDDDHYAPTHIETMSTMAERGGYRLIGSEEIQRYHNVAHRCFRVMNNIGASLCQTAVHRSLFKTMRATIQACMVRNSFGVDTNLWRSVSRNEWAFTRQMTCVGIKGLPGRVGLGIGHRPDARWTPDPALERLRSWIGDDVSWYDGASAPFHFSGRYPDAREKATL
jgi:hypothetical protein